MNSIIKNIFRWPNNPNPIEIKNSVVLTLDKHNENYPVMSEFNNELKPQVSWLLFYIFVWVFLITIISQQENTKERVKCYLAGFFVGLIVSLLDIWISSNLTSILVSNTDRQHDKGYILNTPYIKDVDKGQLDENNINEKYLIPKYSAGDYKILINNDIYPTSDKYGYIIKAEDYLKQENNGSIVGTNYDLFLQKSSYKTTTEKYNKIYDSHTKNKIGDVFLEHLNDMSNISKSAYCIGIIIITWSIYISRSKWGNKYHILWMMIALTIVITATGLVNSTKNIVQCNNVVFVKQRMLILAISFGITSVLIS